MEFIIQSVVLVVKITCGIVSIVVLLYLAELLIKVILFPFVWVVHFVWDKLVRARIKERYNKIIK